MDMVEMSTERSTPFVGLVALDPAPTLGLAVAAALLIVVVVGIVILAVRTRRLAAENDSLTAELSRFREVIAHESDHRDNEIRRSSALQRVAELMSAEITRPDAAMNAVCRSILDAVPQGTHVVIVKLARDGHSVQIVGSAHIDPAAETILRETLASNRVPVPGEFVHDLWTSRSVRVIRNTPVNVAIEGSPEPFRPFIEQYGIGAVVQVPINTAEDSYGQLQIRTRAGTDFSKDDELFAGAAGNMLGLALTTASLVSDLDDANHLLAQRVEERSRTLRRSEALQELTARLTTSITEPTTVMNDIAQMVLDAVETASQVAITELSDDREYLNLVALAHSDPKAASLLLELNREKTLVRDSSVRFVVDTGKSRLVPTLTRDQSLQMFPSRYHPYVEQYGIGAIVQAPIYTSEGIYGVLNVSTPFGSDLGRDDQDYAEAIARVLGLALTTATLWNRLVAANNDLEIRIEKRSMEAERSQSLQQLTTELTRRVGEPAELVQFAVDGVRKSVPGAHLCLLLEPTPEDRGSVMAMAMSAGPAVPVEQLSEALTEPTSVDTNVLSVIMRNRKGMILNDISREQMMKLPERFHRVIARMGYGSGLFVPVTSGPEVLAILVLHAPTGATFDGDDLDFCEQAAKVIGLSLTTSTLWSALEESRKELEQRVNERTADLEASKKQLQQAVDSLARSNEDLRRFAYVASHDLQAPLRTVGGFTEVLMASLGEDQFTPDQRMMATHIREGAARMQRLIRDLLEFTKLGSETKNRERVAICDAHKDVVLSLSEDIVRSGAQVECSSTDTVFAVPTQVRQILQNLIGNAIAHAAGSERLMIRTTSRPIAGGMIEVSVADNGIGIPKKDQERVFEMFKQLKPGVGSGMGLAIAARIADLEGGTIRVESDGEKGSTFIFTLPATARE